MLDCKKLFILIAALAFFCVPADFPAAAANNIPTSKQVHRPKGKAAHPKSRKHAKTGKQKKASAAGEQTGVFTAYTGTAGKKHPPRKTADGTPLKEISSCLLANNRLPAGTMVFIEGIGTCEVRDRIGKKTGPNRFDIHMKDSREAKNFGKRKLKYRILSKPEKT
jgi:3D (Asp-Asp-Asp) domain-containing protein